MDSYFPVICADALRKIGLLVKAKRLVLGLRQADLKASLGVSTHTLRKIESGSEAVDLRSFLLVLWRLGLTEAIFASLDSIELTPATTLENKRDTIASRRVRLTKPRPEDF
ncbi:helix-turn-helix domain-containing protein [Pseudomonas huanghezhanensis]|uniref:transcriptional regulator n=1 Tax=Pseudomonas huanghezhanensis TaxID=3002903 RepID=UPI002286284F|nr:transcriptional regulator [Pseudomonas sp. BSw22131]